MAATFYETAGIMGGCSSLPERLPPPGKTHRILNEWLYSSGLKKVAHFRASPTNEHDVRARPVPGYCPSFPHREPRRGAIFDVGANAGQTSLRLAREFPLQPIYAFEPHPETFAALERNAAGKKTIIPMAIALDAAPGQRQLFTYKNSALNSLTDRSPFTSRFGLAGTAIEVPTTSIDQFCLELAIERIHLLKVDTEGLDLDVLKGAANMLQRGAVSFVYFEFNDLTQPKNAAGGSLIEVDGFLRRYDFRFVASYTDFVDATGDFFMCGNALYMRTDQMPNRPTG